MKPVLSGAELAELRASLIEYREIHTEREYLRQIRSYLRQQGLAVELSPSAAGIRIVLKED